LPLAKHIAEAEPALPPEPKAWYEDNGIPEVDRATAINPRLQHTSPLHATVEIVCPALNDYNPYELLAGAIPHTLELWHGDSLYSITWILHSVEHYQANGSVMYQLKGACIPGPLAHRHGPYAVPEGDITWSSPDRRITFD